jgi:hypothetical protein
MVGDVGEARRDNQERKKSIRIKALKLLFLAYFEKLAVTENILRKPLLFSHYNYFWIN